MFNTTETLKMPFRRLKTQVRRIKSTDCRKSNLYWSKNQLLRLIQLLERGKKQLAQDLDAS